jgi:hypothetical protein
VKWISVPQDQYYQCCDFKNGCYGISLDTLAITQLVKNILPFIDPTDPSPCLQKPPCPGTVQSSPQLHTFSSKIRFNIALDYGLGDQGFESRKGLGIFLFTTGSIPLLGSTQPPIQWVPGNLSLGVKRPGFETDHSNPSSTQVKNAWSYTSTLTIRLHGVCSVKSHGQLYILPSAPRSSR